MILEIEIPLEYVDDFNKDKFSDFFHRVLLIYVVMMVYADCMRKRLHTCC